MRRNGPLFRKPRSWVEYRPMSERALADIRVVDISREAAGAWCARMFAAFGAEVTTLTGPGGHPLRMDGALHPETSALAEYVLDGRAAVIPVASPRDELARIRSADVLISDYRPSELHANGITYEALASERLVMIHVTPFGMAGELAEVPGNDLAVGALSGWASINGKADREPLKPSGWQSSYCAGVAAYAAGVAALRERRLSGLGQEIDAGALDVMVAAYAPALLRAGYAGEPIGRSRSTDITTGPVPVADGHFALTISRAHFWRDAMNLLDLPDLAEDPRWETSHYRQAHKNEYVSRVQEQMSKWTKMDLFDELAARRVVAGPVLTIEELMSLDHLNEREFWVEGADGKRWPGAPFRMSATPWSREPGKAVEPATPASPGFVASNGPLTGLRGIVLTQAWAGTFCTEMLGLMGADVIQIEVRKRLDSWRGPYEGPIPEALKDVPTATHPWNVNPLYNSVNLNKRCITLDLQDPEGLAIFKKLLPYADFVAENFSPRVLGNLGIGYDAMRAIKPDVVLCSLSAYGHSGSWTNVPGIGGTIEPSSGMSALLGYEDGLPLNSGQMYPDAVAGLYGCSAILTALHYRDRTGHGQEIDLSMQDANLTFIGDAAVEYANTGQHRPRMGNHHPIFAPHAVYPAAGDDSWVALACETDNQWGALVRTPGLESLAGDERFATRERRKANETALDAALSEWTRTQDRDTAVEMLRSAGIIAVPVLDGRELQTFALLRERGTVVDVTHPDAGSWPQAGIPVHFSRTPGRVRRPAPRLGEQSAEVLEELLNYPREQYEALVAAGITGSGPPGERDVI